MNSQNFEQMMNLYHSINLYCGIVAVVFLLLAVFLFFWLRIPAVFSELSGRGAKKAIKEMVAADDGTGQLSSSRKIGEDGRRHRKRETGRIGRSGTGRLRKNTGHLSGGLKTDRLVPPVQENPAEMAFSEGGQPTGVLDSGSQATTLLDDGGQATSVLQHTAAMDYGSAGNRGETMVLDAGAAMMGTQTKPVSSVGFVIERSIVEVHTDEVI